LGETAGALGAARAPARWGHPRNDTGAHIRAALRIETALRDPERAIELLPEDHALLRAAVSEPTAGYPTLSTGDGLAIQIGRALLPYIDAVERATDEPPAAETEDRTENGGTTCQA
jgi:hypothetical protein